MTEEQWSVLSTILGIIVFIGTGVPLVYSGHIDLKNYNDEEDKIKVGKNKIFWGWILITFSTICVIVLIYVVKNGIIIDDSDSSHIDPKIMTESLNSSSSSETNEIYIEKLSYQGAVYSGYINELRQPDGKGTMKYSDGKEYIGNWVNGIQEGQGIMKYNNGVYEGEWQNGKRNGKGVYTWNDGKKYEGEYKDDTRSGEGVFTGWVDLTNGYSGTYYGESKKDKFDGYGYFIFDNGDRFDGVYKEDLYWTGIYTRNDGSCYEVINGQPK